MVALSNFNYLQTLPGTPSMPHEFLNKSISEFCSISASCTAIILLLWLHPLCHLSPCVPFTGQHQIFIASLFFNNLCTAISQPFPPSPPFWLFPLTGEKGPFRDSPSHALFWWLLFFVHPNFFLAVSNSTTLISTFFLYFVLSFCLLLPCLPPSPSVPSRSFSCLWSEPSSSSSALHAEILGEGGEPRRQRGWACGRAGGYRRRGWGQYRCQVSSSGDDLLLAVPRHLWSFTGHRLLHRLYWLWLDGEEFSEVGLRVS